MSIYVELAEEKTSQHPLNEGKILQNTGTELFEKHLSLVDRIVRRYSNLFTAAFDFEDARQEGCIGLLNAVAEFDPSKGEFPNHASFWIRKHILEAVADQSRLIRIPESAIKILLKSNRQRSDLKDVLGRSPTTEELATFMDINPEYLQDIIRGENEITSLNTAAFPEEDGRIKEATIPDEAAVSPLSIVITRESISKKMPIVNTAVTKLSESNRKILQLRYRLGEGVTPEDPDSYNKRTFEEIGEIIGTDKAGAWGRHSRAIKKLARDPELREFWDLYYG